MKKILHIALILVYLPAALGVAFNIHYCKGEVKSVDVFSASKKSCCCGHEYESGCCNEEREWVKLDENSQVSTGLASFKTKVSSQHLFVFPVTNITAALTPGYSSVSIANSGPPLVLDKEPVYIRLRTFLI